jgi:hypothetical protein
LLCWCCRSTSSAAFWPRIHALADGIR